MIRCDVLIPTADRPAALAVTLAGLAAQSARLRVVVADQSVAPAADHPAVASLLRALQVDGAEVEVHRRTERRGVAEQRDFLLGRADSAHVLCLDDDVWLRPWAVQTLQDALVELACGFVGMAVVGLSHRDDHRPEQLATFTPWDGDDVAPERIRPGDAAWRRHELHNAANPLHLAGSAPHRRAARWGRRRPGPDRAVPVLAGRGGPVPGGGGPARRDAGADPSRARGDRPGPGGRRVRRDLAAAGSVLSGSGIDDDEALVVVHPGATDPRRRWPAQRFATVAHGLAAAGARVVVVGSAPEAALVARVADAVPGAVALAGVLDLPGLAGLLARAALLVGNDSGPRHLAEAVGTRTVSVYWFGNVINAAPATRQRHRVHISWTTRCPVCNLPCVGEPFPDRCPHDVSFVADVAVDLVRDSARALLADAMADGTAEEPGAATPGSATPAGPGWAARGSAARAISPG